MRCFMHVRSALVAIISLPMGLYCFYCHALSGLNAYYVVLWHMRLRRGDGRCYHVMIENAHKRPEEWQAQHRPTLDNKRAGR